MNDFKRKLLIRRILYSPLTGAILFILILFVGNGTLKMLKTYLNARGEYTASQAELQILKDREKNIKEKIEGLSTERGVEEEIRNKLGLIKEGEGVIIIADPPISSETEAEGGGIEGGIKGFFENVLNIFR